MFLINSCSQLVSSTDFSSTSKSLHLHISVPSPEVTAPFCLVPSPEFSQAPWYSLPDHLCRFGVRATDTLAPKLFLAAGITGFGPYGPHRHTSPSCPADLPTGRAACLTTENHLRGRLPLCVTPVLSYYPDRSQRAGIRHPEGRHQPDRRLVLRASDLSVANRWENINSLIHSTTPVGLALGPD